MKKKLKVIFIVCMIFIYTNESAQSLLCNMVNSTLNDGKSKNIVPDKKKSGRNAQAWVSLQDCATPGLSLFSEYYFIMKLI